MSVRVQVGTLFNITASVLLLLCGSQASGPEQQPRDIVARYCSLDLEGARLTSQGFARMGELYAWEEEPGWDGLTITEKFVIKNQDLHGNSATVTVEYKNLGALDGNTFKSSSGMQDVEFELQKRHGQWVILSPVIEPHVSPLATRRHIENLIRDEGPDSARNWKQALESVDSLITRKKQNTHGKESGA